VIKWPVKLRTFFYVFYVFFQSPKKHDFLRFFEWLTTFSRTLVSLSKKTAGPLYNVKRGSVV